ncbi:MAG TPA: hypothetical protein VMH39_07330 [Gemmatimonadaceae bacterium]|nr:hypothetical protein [Gemmatimonadaceae bacterium]
MAKMALDDLTSQLRAAYGDDLVAIVLYGSVAAGTHIAKRSDHNVLVIAKRLGLDQLRASGAVARAWAEAGNPPPLTFTVEEWHDSSDIFPMEYADILDRHRVLYGQPPFEGIAVRPADLRLQVEHEAMGKLLLLRQGILASGGDEGRLVSLLADSISTILVIFRACVRLQGASPQRDSDKVIDSVAGTVGFDPAPFHRALRQARGDDRIPKSEAIGVIDGYVTGMERLVAYVDRLTV